jgi:hypothetical protein
MKINDAMKLPEGTNYYEVSEEVWYQTGPDDADRDFDNFQTFDNFAEAIAAVLKSNTHNRLYIDLMVRTNKDGRFGAYGLPVWSGSRLMMLDCKPTGWLVNMQPDLPSGRTECITELEACASAIIWKWWNARKRNG